MRCKAALERAARPFEQVAQTRKLRVATGYARRALAEAGQQATDLRRVDRLGLQRRGKFAELSAQRLDGGVIRPLELRLPPFDVGYGCAERQAGNAAPQRGNGSVDSRIVVRYRVCLQNVGCARLLRDPYPTYRLPPGPT